MMKNFAPFLLLATVLSACQPTSVNQAPKESTASVAASAAAASSASTMQLPRFEIRDFKLDEEKQKYGGVQVKGRGTLIAVDDVQRRGSFIVWLTAKQEHDNDSPSLKMIVLRDGVGTFETFD